MNKAHIAGAGALVVMLAAIAWIVGVGPATHDAGDLEVVMGNAVFTEKAIQSSYLEGSWVEPIPGMTSGKQGFKLERGELASSINMATLTYTAVPSF